MNEPAIDRASEARSHSAERQGEAMELDLVIPTYNRWRLLEQCLTSVETAFKPAGLKVNVVVVDNNSTDETRARVCSLQDRGFRLQYLFVGRPGKSAALNDALEQTSAELVGLIDDDEQLDAAWFEVAVREFSADPLLEYIGGPYLPNWECAAPGWLPDGYRGAIGIVPRTERVAFSRRFSGMLMGGNAVIQRKTLAKVLPYPEELGKIGERIRSGEDEVIYQRLLDLGARGMVVPDLIVRHWIPAERMTRSYFRRWVVGRGISVGIQLRERGFDGPGFLGLPRHHYSSLARAIAALPMPGPAEKRFTAQLNIFDFFATACGRYFCH